MNTTTPVPPPILVHCRRAPYGSSLARSGIDLAMATAAFDVPVSLLFSGEAVWQLVTDQQPAGERNHGKVLGALPIYGVDNLYVDAAALAARHLSADDLCLEVRAVDTATVRALLRDSRHVITF